MQRASLLRKMIHCEHYLNVAFTNVSSSLEDDFKVPTLVGW